MSQSSAAKRTDLCGPAITSDFGCLSVRDCHGARPPTRLCWNTSETCSGTRAAPPHATQPAPVRSARTRPCSTSGFDVRSDAPSLEYLRQGLGALRTYVDQAGDVLAVLRFGACHPTGQGLLAAIRTLATVKRSGTTSSACRRLKPFERLCQSFAPSASTGEGHCEYGRRRGRSGRLTPQASTVTPHGQCRDNSPRRWGHADHAESSRAAECADL